MSRCVETEFMRLETADHIEAIVTDIATGTETKYVGFVHGANRTCGNVRRGDAVVLITPKDTHIGYIPKKRRPKKGYPIPPDLYVQEIPMPPVRTYLNMFSTLIMYVPTAEMINPGGKTKVVIRRATLEAAMGTAK